MQTEGRKKKQNRTRRIFRILVVHDENYVLKLFIGSRLVRWRSVHNVRAKLAGRFFVPHAGRQRGILDTRTWTFERGVFAHQAVSLDGKGNNNNY